MQQHIKTLSEGKRLYFWRTVFFIYTVLLFVATLVPLSIIQGGGSSWLDFLVFKHSDKVVHFIMFFLMTILLYLSYNFTRKIWYFTIPVLTGIVIEFLQYFMAQGRTFDFLDIIGNTTGIFIAYYFILKR